MPDTFSVYGVTWTAAPKGQGEYEEHQLTRDGVLHRVYRDVDYNWFYSSEKSLPVNLEAVTLSAALRRATETLLNLR